MVFLGCGLEPYCSSPRPPHLKSEIHSPSGNLDWVKWGLSPPHTWQQLNATHIPSSVTPGTVSMTATGKPFQTGLGGREWQSLLQSSLSPAWTRHSEKPGTGVKLIAQSGRDWGPTSTMQPENLSLCLVRVAVVQPMRWGGWSAQFCWERGADLWWPESIWPSCLPWAHWLYSTWISGHSMAEGK